MSVCRVCEREFEPIRSKGHRKTQCSACYARIRRYRFKRKAVEYKGGKCVDCGFGGHFSAMDFHHEGDAEKEYKIAAAYNRRWSSIQQELDKCVLLCANCHRLRHFNFVPTTAK